MYQKLLAGKWTTNLNQKIKTKKARVAVVGLGYVGLPTAVAIANAGFKVVGIDIWKERVKKINLWF